MVSQKLKAASDDELRDVLEQADLDGAARADLSCDWVPERTNVTPNLDDFVIQHLEELVD